MLKQIICTWMAMGWLAAVGCARAEANVTFTNQVVPGPNDPRIAYVTARMLEQNHYLRHPLDDDFSARFLDRYLDNLDPLHMNFTQADVREFAAAYRTNLDDLTLERNGKPDVSPAFVIFGRFMERLTERNTLVTALLKTNNFKFDTDERILLDRRDAAYPRDLAEARQLWVQRLRFEYLQEKIAHTADPKATNTAPTNMLAKTEVPTNGVAQPGSGGSTNLVKTVPETITDVLEHRYARMLRLYREWDNEDVMEVYLTSLAHVYDPHSDYLNKTQADNFAINMNLALFGIGAELGSEDGYCVIRKLRPGPAAKSKKLNEGDKIVAVAQGEAPAVDVVDMSLNKAVQLIRGPKGTEVRLTIIPVDSPRERRIVSLIRDEIKLEDQAAKAKVIEIPRPGGKPLRIGVIDLPSFYATIFSRAGNAPGLRSTSVDIARILKKLTDENVSGVILDLRRNGGGSLEEAIKLTGLFIKEGPIVQVRGPDGPPLVEDDNDGGAAYLGPLIVLTSRYSASASEILAGALQDYGRALIVGDLSTHGKGTVQNVNPLSPWVRPATPTATNDPGELKMTIRKFYRAGGASTQLKGVLSDIVLPSVRNYSKDVGEGALDNALPWDTIPSAGFDKLDLVGPYLPDLLQRSNQRLATNKDFAYIREDIELFRKQQADKTVSLNEKDRLKEKEELDERNKARDKERQERGKLDAKIYDLTLENLDTPGLPAPVGATNAAAAPGAGSSVLKRSDAIAADDLAGESKSGADPMLDEAERILQDYISLLAAKTMIAGHGAKGGDTP